MERLDKRRTLCPHCNQSISYSAYFAHKARYFDSQTLQWMLQSDLPGLPEEMQVENNDLIQGPNSDMDDEAYVQIQESEFDSTSETTSFSSEEQDHELLEV